MAAVCAECEEGVDTTYDCRECGDAYCVDCRVPTDHDCEGGTVDESIRGSGASGEGLVTSWSIPEGPRIETFLPVHRVIPWPVAALLIALVVPLVLVAASVTVYEPLLFGLALPAILIGIQAYHERLVADEDEWRPTRLFYLPALLFVFAFALPAFDAFFAIVLGYFFGLIGTAAYVVGKKVGE
jgi:hypothetical protein